MKKQPPDIPAYLLQQSTDYKGVVCPCTPIEKCLLHAVPKVLEQIADRVLAYRPKSKTKAAKRRKRRDQYAKRRKSESSI